MQGVTNRWSSDDAYVPDALREADVRDLDLLYDSSNYVFLASLAHPEYGEAFGVYKPAAGEAPLSDFPYGSLHRREVAVYELSRLLGWQLAPPIVERDGPRGIGSMQLYIEHDPARHYFALRGEAVYQAQLVRLATFDLVANNADRKGGHILLDAQGRLWGIDNALCFHRVEKLRTVIWDFAGTTVPDELLADIQRVSACLAADDASTTAFRALLHPAEVVALLRRIDALLAHPVLPEMYPWRCVPWPLI